MATDYSQTITDIPTIEPNASVCYQTTLLLTGTTTVPTDADAYYEYSDGYQLTAILSITTGSLPTAAGIYGICFGNALTTTAAALGGAYCLQFEAAVNDSDAAVFDRSVVGGTKALYYTPAQWTTLAGNYNVVSQAGLDLSSDAKYGLVLAATINTAATGIWVDAATLTGTFNMPLEPTTTPATDGPTSATDDRLDRGEKIAAVGWAGATSLDPDNLMTLCTEEAVTLVLGAEMVTLGASIISFLAISL